MRVRIITQLILFTLIIGVNSCDTSGSVDPVYKQYFIKYYGEDGDQEGNDFVINPDGTIIILGTSTFGINKRIYLVKVDPEGNEIWKKTLGSQSNELAVDIEPIINGPDVDNFLVLSNVAKNDVDYDIRLTVINLNGDSLKSTLFNQLQSQEAKSVTPLTDGGYFVSGKTTDTDQTDGGNAGLPDPSSDVEDLLIIRFQSDFSFIPSDVYRIGGSYVGSALKIFQEGNAFYYAGDSDEITKTNLPDNNTYESNLFFRTFTENPASVSSIYSGSLTLPEKMGAIARSPSGVFMAIGTRDNLTGTDKQLYGVTLTNNFKAIQTEDVIDDGGGQREAVAVASSGASRFLILANEFNAALNRDIYLRKTNVQLDKDFEVKFGAPNNDDTGNAVAELPNGDILILGTMSLTNQRKIALIKLRSNGQF